ncbi:MAG: carbonic anhydrase family protein [Rhodoferax sp.]|nr:carbonic anhydrase family protein [Rhodoferax sp.]
MLAGLLHPARALAADPARGAASAPTSATAKPAAKAASKPAEAEAAGKSVGDQVRDAVAGGVSPKRLTLVVSGKEKKYITVEPRGPIEYPAKPAEPEHDGAKSAGSSKRPVTRPSTGHAGARAKAAAMAGHDAEAHWAYEGDSGPQAWGKLKPDFNLCAMGKRQSPINIEDGATLQGPAEPLQFHYLASGASVVNNGHTIQVDMLGENFITVRGSNYKLVQLHFHHPSEERVNFKSFAMVAHLVHKNAEGQLAVVAVLLEPGAANAVINSVWTYMPLDAGDRVRMPTDSLDLTALLPKDQRYYQFLGSLTTPPCTEGVLWMVLKTPTTISREQIKLFAQLFPNNARPVQPLNNRPVREAQ